MGPVLMVCKYGLYWLAPNDSAVYVYTFGPPVLVVNWFEVLFILDFTSQIVI